MTKTDNGTTNKSSKIQSSAMITTTGPSIDIFIKFALGFFVFVLFGLYIQQQQQLSTIKEMLMQLSQFQKHSINWRDNQAQ